MLQSDLVSVRWPAGHYKPGSQPICSLGCSLNSGRGTNLRIHQFLQVLYWRLEGVMRLSRFSRFFDDYSHQIASILASESTMNALII
jgi:hypothetical protein